MAPEEILSQLRDIHEAKPPSWWPPAPGYYLLVLLFLLALLLGLFIIRLRKRWRLKKAILRELKSIEDQFYAHQDISSLQGSLSALFRRLALLKMSGVDGRLDLDEMALILVRIMPNQERTLSIIELLKRDRFHKAPQIDGALLLSLSREQIKRCRI